MGGERASVTPNNDTPHGLHAVELGLKPVVAFPLCGATTELRGEMHDEHTLMKLLISEMLQPYLDY